MSVVQSTTIQVPEWAVGFVYLLETSDRYQKIGFSLYPSHRGTAFLNLPFAAWLGHVFPVGDKLVEREIHHRFRYKRVRGEWFCLTAGEVESVKRLTGVRGVTDLPADIGYHAPACVVITPARGSRPTVTPTRAPTVWYRTDRDQWYTHLDGRQVPLRVFGADSKSQAQATLDELLIRLAEPQQQPVA
jgi:hypothetical protein